MILQRFALFFSFFIFSMAMLLAQAENRIAINFQPLFGDKKIEPDGSSYLRSSGDSLQIDALRFYISNIELWQGKRLVWQEKNSQHLLDVEQANSLIINLKTEKKLAFNQLKFDLGIDSITNVSGAMGGDLDPTKGMYWTWQSGYINFKLEGSSPLSAARNHEFQFHLGGYAAPHNCLKTIQLKIKNKEKIAVVFDVRTFLLGIDLAQQNHIMSPCKEAVLLAEKAKNCFRIAD